MIERVERDASGLDCLDEGPRRGCGVDVVPGCGEGLELRAEQQLQTDVGRGDVEQLGPGHRRQRSASP